MNEVMCSARNPVQRPSQLGGVSMTTDQIAVKDAQPATRQRDNVSDLEARLEG